VCLQNRDGVCARPDRGKEKLVKLYSLALSPYAARVRASIYAKGLPVEIVPPPSDWRTSSEFRALNPLCRIPVLQLDDGTAIAESGVIVEYLEDAFPVPSLRPATARGLARVRLITQVADLYVMQALMPIFYLVDNKQRDEAAIAAQFAKLDDGLAQLNPMLTPGTPAFGGRLTTADPWLAPVCFTLEGLMAFAGRPDLLARYEAIAGYGKFAQADPVLGRVWREMTDGLADFMKARAAVATG
jgi:glutathione S-transferase